MNRAADVLGKAARDLADAAHYLCMLHGRRPGLTDLAANRTESPDAHNWLMTVSAGFEHERAYLARLTVAAGPVPATPGQAATDAAVLGQRQALEMLFRSDRRGCALGAALGLVLDWHAVRPLLDAVAKRFDVRVPPMILPDTISATELAERIADTPTIERAMLFGAAQILAQHRGLWNLLEARRAAREQL
ncbi:hypothetical protein CLG96_13830 [Sphingomonas oleivorans]|uniref:Uncharacterized protein n=1 Tax=Sphingomonas oleivorans TaxID=1735121 RepID=A0A2T5FX28_9SPHN|nr:hypothetical protein CLG96_13830 [Sphingomonas oleivorans]